MDLTLPKDDLTKALYVTQSVVEKKTTMPILSNVLLSVVGSSLKISATDLEIAALASVKANVRSTGSLTVNARMFSDIVRELPEADVTLKLKEGGRLEISCKNSRLTLVGVSADEFPSLPGISFDTRSRVGSKQLVDMINKSIYAVAVDETRFNLTGVCFELIGGEGKKSQKSLRLVATDGHRLAMVTRPLDGLELAERVIVPRKGLAEIKRVIDGDEEREIGIDIRDGFLIVESGHDKISVRLIDGEFPDYKQVFPKEKGTQATVQTGEFVQALRRTALMVSDKGKCVRLDFGKNSLRLSSSSPELGEAVDEVSVKYDGDPLSIGFNAKYLLDLAASFDENQQFVITLNGELGPGKFHAESDESYIGIIMPMRLG